MGFPIENETTAWYRINSEVKPGDTVKMKNGEVYEFVRLKQKYFVGTKLSDGVSYNVPVTWYQEVLEKAKKNDGYKTLKHGEPFYINKGGKDALLFFFDGFEKGRIIGINPVGNVRTRIDVSLYAGKVSEYKG